MFSLSGTKEPDLVWQKIFKISEWKLAFRDTRLTDRRSGPVPIMKLQNWLSNCAYSGCIRECEECQKWEGRFSTFTNSSQSTLPTHRQTYNKLRLEDLSIEIREEDSSKDDFSFVGNTVLQVFFLFFFTMPSTPILVFHHLVSCSSINLAS